MAASPNGAARRPARRKGAEAGLLEAALNRHYAPRGQRIALYGPAARTSRSTIFFGEGPHFRFPVAVKQCLGEAGGASPAAAAGACYAAMRRLHAVTAADDIIASPPPLDLIPELGVVMTEWVPGRNLQALLGEGEDLALIELAGAWLGRLAFLSCEAMRPLEVASMLGQVERPALPDPLRAAVALLRDTAPLAAGAAVTWYPSYGDFKPENLMLVEGRLFGIDSQMDHVGPDVLDAAHFLNHAATRAPLRLFGRDSAARDATLERVFREGHRAAGGVAMPELPLLWTRLHAAVRLALGYRAWSRPPRAWVTGCVARRLVAMQRDRLARLAAGIRAIRRGAAAGGPGQRGAGAAGR